MNCILVGDRSVIGSALGRHLSNDGWNVIGQNKTSHPSLWDKVEPWDFLLCSIGSLGPVGHWSERNLFNGPFLNATYPIKEVQVFWRKHAPNAKICFLAGGNPNKTMPSYVAYQMGKACLIKAVENMDAETPDATIFTLSPGFVPTRFHQPTLEAGIKDVRLENPPPVADYIPRIYECLKWCLQQPKEVLGGRNIHVNDPWDKGNELAARLALNPNLYKLRRAE